MREPTIAAVSADHRSKVLHTLALGFAADPFARWVWPDAGVYVENFPKFAITVAGAAFDQSTAYIVEGCSLASLWLPPGVPADQDGAMELLAETVRPDIITDLQAIAAQRVLHHPTNRPNWYLFMIAADPAYLGRGLGTAMMTHVLRRCDADGTIVYLESSNPRNLTLYMRHGFHITGEIRSGSSPPIFPMIRERC